MCSMYITMSGTGSLMIRNLRRPADYQKAVMTQDQLLRIAAANDANIASARQAYSQGETVPLTPQQSATAEQLQADAGKNESDAISNLLSMGFRYDTAADIVARTTNEERVILNNAFPEIKNDFGRKFVVARTTSTAFIEYLRNFIQTFNQTKGVSNSTTLFNDKFDAIINNIQDLRAIIPPPDLVMRLATRVEQLPVGDEVREMFQGLAETLPNEQFFRDLDAENAFDRAQDLTKLQNILANLPTRDEFQKVSDDINSGRVSQAEAVQELSELVSGIDATTLSLLEQLSEEVRTGAVPNIAITAKVQIPTARIQGLGWGAQVSATGQATREALYVLDRDGNPTGSTFTNKDLQSLLRTDSQFNQWSINTFGKKPTYTQLVQFVQEGGSGMTASASAMSDITGYSGFSGATSMASDTETSKSGLGVRKTIKTKKIGMGLAVKEAPTYRQFGKYVLHQNQLLNNDMLNVKYPSLGRIPQFKPTSISEPTKEFIIDLLETGKANSRVYDTLPKEERKLFEKIATGAGVFHTLKLKKTTTDDEARDYDRFQVLRGEYIAGNNSQALTKELRRLIVKFINEGRIHKSEGMNLLMELSI